MNTKEEEEEEENFSKIYNKNELILFVLAFGFK